MIAKGRARVAPGESISQVLGSPNYWQHDKGLRGA